MGIGTETFMEVCSPNEGFGTRRIAELILWEGPNGDMTLRAYVVDYE